MTAQEGAAPMSGSQWKFDKHWLVEMIKNRSVDNLKEAGGVDTLSKALGSSIESGLAASDAHSEARTNEFGKNMIEQKPPKGLWALFMEAMKDTTVIILAIAAVISIALGIVGCLLETTRCPPQIVEGESHEEEEGICLEWIDGLAICCAVLAVSGITAINDYKKELQFRSLNDAKNDILVKVVRDGVNTRVSTHDVVVGDLVQIDTGDKIPADGVFVTGHDLRIDESSLTGESDTIKKDHSRPFMLSGCTVTEGVGSFIVTAVGENSEWGIIMKELGDDREETPLQEKLTVLAENIGKLGVAVASVCFVAQILRWLIELDNKTCFVDGTRDCGISSESACDLKDKGKWDSTYNNFDSAARLPDLVTFFIESVTIIVVAVPEGLPLAVTLSLAYSVRKMMSDNNLVRVLAACETMGGATNICSDKTGTLTENRMSVVKGYFQGKFFPQLPTASDLNDSYIKRLCMSVSTNSKAFLGAEAANGQIEFIGNKTECALLVMARRLGVDYNVVRKDYPLEHMYAFSSAKKKMSCIVKVDGTSTLFVKGASEIVLEGCTKCIGSDGSASALSEGLRKELNDVIVDMAKQGLRTICIAEKAMPNDNVPDDAPEDDLTCLAIVGIKDPLRKEVPGAIETCRGAGITVRMVTGDNILTAQTIARECGILTDGEAIEGPVWRKLTKEQQYDLLPKLQVMARAHPTDKLVLVKRLKERDEVVAVTGDGTNDAPALKEANVGLSMGIAGTEVAKEASDVVILDDNFASIVKSVLWGRSVFDNIRRFLTFQLTVNVVALTVTFVGAVTGYGIPLKPIQLLWVNLIMDSMGALALATELPTPELLTRKPYGKKDSLISTYMYRNIAVQSIYQTIGQLVILYAGWGIFYRCVKGTSGGDQYIHDSNNCISLSNADGDKFANKDAQTYVYTIIFNTFVWEQVFNEINARKIFNEKNMFAGFFSNHIFVAVIIMTGIVQIVLVMWGGVVFATLPLDAVDWVVCIILGLLSLPIGLLSRYLPTLDLEKWTGKLVAVFKKPKVHPEKVATPEPEQKGAVDSGLNGGITKEEP